MTEGTGRRYCESSPWGISSFAPATNELTSKGRERGSCTSRDRDCGGNGGGGVHFVTSGGLPGHLAGAAYCVYPASVVSRAPACTKYGPASPAHDAPASIR